MKLVVMVMMMAIVYDNNLLAAMAMAMANYVLWCGGAWYF